ncbi:uncharacterized protein LOC142327259 isoform X2 [Lycorma delicatula]|uniref:uncharacterized protein LOC142327259 isoform X2 n=1 Tax=Lycorma delicatula TaxID=130591 RepID=UPI003F50E094
MKQFNFRPAGMSSDEDSDDGIEFSMAHEKNSRSAKTFNQPKLTPEEQLFNAVKSEDLPKIKELINDGVNINCIDGGWTPLMYACFQGFPDVLEVLLKNGANLNFHKDFFTPLMAVCSNATGSRSKQYTCVEILLNLNVDIDAADRFRSTALMLAAKEGLTTIVKKFIEHGCNIDKIDKEGWTALFHAVSQNKIKIVELLLDAGASIKTQDLRGRTVYDLAMIKGFEEIAEKVMIKETTEEQDILFNIPPVITVKQMLNELPSKNSGENPGFPSDVYNLLSGMNLQSYAECFYKNNIQLGDFLIINDEKLKEIDVRFSAHRRQILESLKRFHLHRWQKSSLGLKPKNERIDLVDGVKLVGNAIRQLFVLQSSILYLQINRPKTKLTNELKKIVKNTIHETHLLQKELIILSEFGKHIDLVQKVRSVDLIKPEERNKVKLEKIIKFGIALFFGGIIIWKKKAYCLSFLKVY